MKEIIKEIIEFDLDEGKMDYLDDMIDVFYADGKGEDRTLLSGYRRQAG